MRESPLFLKNFEMLVWLLLATACGSTIPQSDVHGLLDKEVVPIIGRRVEAGHLGEKIAVPVLGKITVLDFWATWCEPCKKQVIPHIEALWRVVDREQVAVLGVAIDQGDENSDQLVRECLAKDIPIDVTFPQIYDGKAARLQGAFRVSGSVPATFVIDRHGRVRFFFDNSPGDIDRLDRAVALLVAE